MTVPEAVTYLRTAHAGPLGSFVPLIFPRPNDQTSPYQIDDSYYEQGRIHILSYEGKRLHLVQFRPDGYLNEIWAEGVQVEIEQGFTHLDVMYLYLLGNPSQLTPCLFAYNQTSGQSKVVVISDSALPPVPPDDAPNVQVPTTKPGFTHFTYFYFLTTQWPPPVWLLAYNAATGEVDLYGGKGDGGAVIWERFPTAGLEAGLTSIDSLYLPETLEPTPRGILVTHKDGITRFYSLESGDPWWWKLKLETSDRGYGFTHWKSLQDVRGYDLFTRANAPAVLAYNPSRNGFAEVNGLSWSPESLLEVKPLLFTRWQRDWSFRTIGRFLFRYRASDGYLEVNRLDLPQQ